jgi:Putative serine esterase (DUF676)
MKNFFISLIVCFGLVQIQAQNNATAQVTVETANWPATLANLNTAQITSGVLIDKVSDFSNLMNFNVGTTNLSDATHFKQALSELYRASDNSRFISTEELQNRSAAATPNTIDVGIINTTLQKLHFNPDNPSSGGLLVQSGVFVPIANRPAFVTKKLVMASPLTTMATGNSITFNFRDELIFNNATTGIKNLTVDFDQSGSNIPIISNGVFVLSTKKVNYTATEYKVLKFVFTFTDNSTTTTFAKLFINYVDPSVTRSFAASPCDEPLREQSVFTSLLPYQGYNENYPVFGKIETTVFYHTNGGNTLKKMLKPIIVVDGFDPKDTRKAQDCDCERDQNPNPKENCRLRNTVTTVTWNSIFPTITTVFNPEKHESLEDLMGYSVSPIQKSNLITELRSKGYDVILVNNPTYSIVNPLQPTIQVFIPPTIFPITPPRWETRENRRTIDGGADYIERNAMTLVSYMQSLKNTVLQNGSSEKLVLIGPSMGGQITRYALAYMEKKFAETSLPIWKHDARLWVSVDSPHLGANIPMGAQASIWFLGKKLYNDDAKAIFDEKLNSVAGKQQILYQFQNSLDTGSSDGQGNGGHPDYAPFFTTYYNNLNSNGVAGSNGYPVTTATFRKIALVNGSLSGRKDGAEGQEFYHETGYLRTNWAGFLASTFAGGAIVGGLFALLGNDTKITGLNLNLKFCSGYGQNVNVFRGDGIFQKIGLQNFYIQHPSYSLYIPNNDMRGSFDVAPGGYLKTAKLIKDDVEKGLSDAGLKYDLISYIENHSFIPTFSALGHLQPNQNWANPLNYNLKCATSNLTPFDSYFGNENNTEHVSFTKEAANWLYEELAGNPQAPYFPIQANVLTGDNIICENQQKTYTIAEICKVPSPVKYNDQNGNPVNGWSVTGNLQIVSSTPYTVTVMGTSNSPSEGKIIATFQNRQKIEKPVHIGAPSVSTIKIGDTYDWVSTYSGSIGIGVAPDSTVTSYIWSVAYDPLDFPVTCPAVNPRKAKFLGGTTVGYVNSLATTSPNASIDYGNCVGTYIVTCTAINACGSTAYIPKETTVGPPSSNPCVYPKTGFKLSIAPNPVKDGQINVVLSKTIDMVPCNYLNNGNKKALKLNPIEEVIENKALIYDLFGNLVYTKTFNKDEFTLTDINLKCGHYILNVFTSKGESSKQVIIVE